MCGLGSGVWLGASQPRLRGAAEACSGVRVSKQITRRPTRLCGHDATRQCEMSGRRHFATGQRKRKLWLNPAPQITSRGASESFTPLLRLMTSLGWTAFAPLFRTTTAPGATNKKISRVDGLKSFRVEAFYKVPESLLSGFYWRFCPVSCMHSWMAEVRCHRPPLHGRLHERLQARRRSFSEKSYINMKCPLCFSSSTIFH